MSGFCHEAYVARTLFLCLPGHTPAFLEKRFLNLLKEYPVWLRLLRASLARPDEGVRAGVSFVVPLIQTFHRLINLRRKRFHLPQ
jgi:hypothetical protein